MERQTLAQWLQSWPYVGRNCTYDQTTGRHTFGPTGEAPNGTGAYVVADGPPGHTRTYAWDLADYVVSSVSGGSLWFLPR